MTKVITITTPEGAILIEGTKVCHKSSPEVCYEEKPEIIDLMVHAAWHRGWPVKVEKKS